MGSTLLGNEVKQTESLPSWCSCPSQSKRRLPVLSPCWLSWLYSRSRPTMLLWLINDFGKKGKKLHVGCGVLKSGELRCHANIFSRGDLILCGTQYLAVCVTVYHLLINSQDEPKRSEDRQGDWKISRKWRQMMHGCPQSWSFQNRIGCPVGAGARAASVWVLDRWDKNGQAPWMQSAAICRNMRFRINLSL